MRNKLSDLNNYLFAQLERLDDEELTGEKLTEEINRTKAITEVAGQIVANGTLVLKAHVAANGGVGGEIKIPLLLEE